MPSLSCRNRHCGCTVIGFVRSRREPDLDSHLEIPKSTRSGRLDLSFELILERTQRQAMLYNYNPKVRRHSSMLAEDAGDTAWKTLVQTVGRLPLPNLTLDRLLRPQG